MAATMSPLGDHYAAGHAQASGNGPPGGMILYVDDDAVGGGNGQSWPAAFRTLQDALTAAREYALNEGEIRIAQGMYRPDRGDGITPGDIHATFMLVDGVSLRGGYAGVNAPNPNERDWDRYPTILDGDLAGDDGPLGTWINYDDNSLHIVLALNLDLLTTIEGLTIQRSGSDFELHFGGGFRAIDSTLVVAECSFLGNRAYSGGAGETRGGNVHVRDCLFAKNLAFNFGAGLSISPSVRITTSTFTQNRSGDHGGALHISGAAIVQSCTFTGNYAASDGGAAHASPIFGVGRPRFDDCFFENNSADYAGAIAGFAECIRCVFRTNYSSTSGGAIMDGGTMIDCVFDSNTAANAGGGAIEGSVIAINTVFVGNDSDTYEGGGGAVNLRSQTIPSLFVNCVFNSNSTLGMGGAARVWPGVQASFVSCAFVDNYSTQDAGGAISGTAAVANSIVWNNTPAQFAGASLVTYSCVAGGWPGPGNIAGDPGFVDRFGPDGLLGTMDDDFRLGSASPCIDAGSVFAQQPDITDMDGDDDLVERSPLDLLGGRRVREHAATLDTGASPTTAAHVDMGPIEFCITRCSPGDVDGDGYVRINDFLAVLLAWGGCVSHPYPCMADVAPAGGDFAININDLLTVLNDWNP